MKNKELKVICCPTGNLVADWISKPLQGSLLTKRRDAMLGVNEEDFDLYKEMYVAVLKQYDLYASEDDLFGIAHRSVLEIMKSCILVSGIRYRLVGFMHSSLNQKVVLEKIVITNVALIALTRALPAISPIKPSTNGAGLLAQHCGSSH